MWRFVLVCYRSFCFPALSVEHLVCCVAVAGFAVTGWPQSHRRGRGQLPLKAAGWFPLEIRRSKAIHKCYSYRSILEAQAASGAKLPERVRESGEALVVIEAESRHHMDLLGCEVICCSLWTVWHVWLVGLGLQAAVRSSCWSICCHERGLEVSTAGASATIVVSAITAVVVAASAKSYQSPYQILTLFER